MELDAIALSLDYRLSVPHHQRIAPSLGHDLSLSFFLISLLQWNRQKKTTNDSLFHPECDCKENLSE